MYDEETMKMIILKERMIKSLPQELFDKRKKQLEEWKSTIFTKEEGKQQDIIFKEFKTSWNRMIRIFNYFTNKNCPEIK